MVAVAGVEQEGVEPDEVPLEVAEERDDEDVGAALCPNKLVPAAGSEDGGKDGAVPKLNGAELEPDELSLEVAG